MMGVMAWQQPEDIKKWRWLQEVAETAQFLLKPRYRRLVEAGAHPLTGHCYVVSEVAYHLLGGRASSWVPETTRVGSDVHWYLRNKNDGTFLDLTEEQFDLGVWHGGRRRAFLTERPSKRAVMMAWLGHHYYGGPAHIGVPR